MKKNKFNFRNTPKPQRDGMIFDSNEELEVYLWLVDLKRCGFISSFKHHPGSIEIIEKKTYTAKKQMKTFTKTVEKFLLHPLTYEPDFEFKPCEKFETLNHGFYKTGEVYFLDSKAEFDYNKSNRIFSIIQKVLYHEKNIFVNKVIPVKLFQKTFAPVEVAYMRNRITPTLRKGYENCKFINNIIDIPKKIENEHLDLFPDKGDILGNGSKK